MSRPLSVEVRNNNSGANIATKVPGVVLTHHAATCPVRPNEDKYRESFRLLASGVTFMCAVGMGLLLLMSLSYNRGRTHNLHDFYMSTHEYVFSNTHLALSKSVYGSAGQTRYCMQVKKQDEGFASSLICNDGQLADGIVKVGVIYNGGLEASLSTSAKQLIQCYNLTALQETWIIRGNELETVYITNNAEANEGITSPKVWHGKYKGYSSLEDLKQNMAGDSCFCPVKCT